MIVTAPPDRDAEDTGDSVVPSSSVASRIWIRKNLPAARFSVWSAERLVDGVGRLVDLEAGARPANATSSVSWMNVGPMPRLAGDALRRQHEGAVDRADAGDHRRDPSLNAEPGIGDGDPDDLRAPARSATGSKYTVSMLSF